MSHRCYKIKTLGMNDFIINKMLGTNDENHVQPEGLFT